MRMQARTDKQGLTYYSFIYDHPETGKPTRIKKEDAPIFRERDKAKAWARTQDTKHAAMREAAQQRLELKSNHHDFAEYAENFTRWKKEKAPTASFNTWQTLLEL